MMRASALILGYLAVGCGAGGYAYEASTTPSDSQYAAPAHGSAARSMAMEPGAPTAAPSSLMTVEASAEPRGDDWGSAGNFETAPSAQGPVSDVQERPRLAQNTPVQQAPPEGAGAPAQQASDGIDLSRPLLIYTARFHLGVYEVIQTQDAILEQLAELGVMLARRSDTELVLRVPAANFERAVDQVEGAGDILHREVNVQDVGEEFRDIAIRLRNAEVMRDRLEALLERADAVEDALAIERELQRLTDIIERFKGRQRYLADQISFSTITIVFQPLSTEPTGPDGFSLPFGWLQELGLSNLMRLR